LATFRTIEWVRETLLLDVPHRQIVLAIAGACKNGDGTFIHRAGLRQGGPSSLTMQKIAASFDGPRKSE
jgi:hypothetical protein